MQSAHFNLEVVFEALSLVGPRRQQVNVCAIDQIAV